MIRHVQAAQKAKAALENSLSSSLPPKPERKRERNPGHDGIGSQDKVKSARR